MSSSVGNITVSNGSFYVEVDGVSTKISIGSLMMAVSLGSIEEIDAEIATKLSEMVKRNEQIEIALELISLVSERAESGDLDANESITINGTTKTFSEWLGEIGVDMPDFVELNAEVNARIDIATEVMSAVSKQLEGDTDDFDLTANVTVNGTTKTIEEWLGDLGIDVPDVVGTVDALQFKLDAAIEICDVLVYQRRDEYDSDNAVTVDGVTKTITEWCEYLGIEYTAPEDLNWWSEFTGKYGKTIEDNRDNAKSVRDNLKEELATEKTRITTNMQTIVSDLQTVLDGLNTELSNINTTGVDTLLEDLQSALDGLNTDSETATLELQNLSEKRANLLQQASVFLKSSNDSMQSVLNNL